MLLRRRQQRLGLARLALRLQQQQFVGLLPLPLLRAPSVHLVLLLQRTLLCALRFLPHPLDRSQLRALSLSLFLFPRRRLRITFLLLLCGQFRQRSRLARFHLHLLQQLRFFLFPPRVLLCEQALVPLHLARGCALALRHLPQLLARVFLPLAHSEQRLLCGGHRAIDPREMQLLRLLHARHLEERADMALADRRRDQHLHCERDAESRAESSSKRGACALVHNRTKHRAEARIGRAPWARRDLGIDNHGASAGGDDRHLSWYAASLGDMLFHRLYERAASSRIELIEAHPIQL